MDGVKDGLVTIGSLVIGVAVLAVILSPRATTAAVIQASASGFSNALGVAMSPVTGANVTLNTSYPNSGNANLSLGTPNLFG